MTPTDPTPRPDAGPDAPGGVDWENLGRSAASGYISEHWQPYLESMQNAARAVVAEFLRQEAAAGVVRVRVSPSMSSESDGGWVCGDPNHRDGQWCCTCEAIRSLRLSGARLNVAALVTPPTTGGRDD